MGGGVDSPQGTDIPVAADLPRGDKPPGVTTAGKELMGEDR